MTGNNIPLCLPIRNLKLDRKVREALERHHKEVAKEYRPVMTVLIGSQNYGLETEKSDYDTCTFVVPTMQEIGSLAEPVSTKIEDDLGHIVIKDIRMGLNLLKKTSPNSVEWFASKNRLVEPEYKDLLDEISPITLRCDTKHMMAAIGSLAHQLLKRNMPMGKRLSHLIRMECMVHSYFDLDTDLLMLPEKERELALKAKRDPDNPKWTDGCVQYEKKVQEAIGKVDLNSFNAVEGIARKTVETLQIEFIRRVFKSCLQKGMNNE